MHDELSAPTAPPNPAGLGSPLSAVARLLGLPEPGLGFSVPPRHRGGIEARSGLDFQDQDALPQLGRLLRQDGQRALSVRLEGTGDTDVLVPREGGGVVEEYRQVKGRREGLAKWTLAELGREGVWSEFIRTTAAFTERAGADRSLLLVFVTDGELDAQLQGLRDAPAAFRNGSGESSPGREGIRGALLMHCALGLLSPSVSGRIQTAAGRDRLRQHCEEIARILDVAWPRQYPVRRVAGEWPGETADAVASLASGLDGEDAALFPRALQDAARHLDFLLESLRFESRVARSGAGGEDLPAGQAEVVLVLIEAGRLDGGAAREAVRKLRAAVADRSLVGATLDEGAVRRIIDLPAPLQLEPFPDAVAARIRRVGVEPAILNGLRARRAVWVYGALRVGKTEAVRGALERGRLRDRTIWLRLSGDGSDIDRIWLHLAFWIGERTGNRELYRALRSGGVQAIEVRGQIARAGGELQAVLVADDVSRVPAAGHGALLASLEEVRLGGVGVVAVAEDRPAGPATGFPASAEPVAIEGFTMAEALQFWRALGKVPADDAATMAAMQIVFRTAGHPEVLRLIAGELPDTPGAAELDAVRDALPAGEGAGLLRDLAWKLFRTGADEFQRGLIPRVALATHEVTEAQARAIAALDPPLRWSAFAWLGLSTTLLEEIRRGRYRLPPIYQAVARMEVAGDDALSRAVHRACADTVLERFSRERSIDWLDLYEVTLDYLFASEWKQAALNALWLANSAPPFPAAQERLQLALLPFRGPAAMTCGLEPDLHVAVLGASVMTERRMDDTDGTRDALAAMRRVAAAGSGEAGYRARTVAALFTAVDRSRGGDHDAAFAAVDPAWREAAEQGDALQLRLLGDIRISAAAFGAAGADVVLEQIEALEHAGETITSLGDLGLNESTPGLVPILFSRVSRAVRDDTRAALIDAFERYLSAFRSRGVPEGIAAVAPSLCALLYDGGRKDDAVALAGEVARELAGTPLEGEGILLLADFHRLEEQWAPAVDAYGRAIPLLRAAGSRWLRAAHTGAALALHHRGDQRLAACHAFAAYRLFAAEEDTSPRTAYEALGRAAILAYRDGRYRLAAACLPRLLLLAADAGDAKRKRLILMLARQIIESIGAPKPPPFGAASGSLPARTTELPAPAAATALGVYFFEQDLDGVGLLGEPKHVSNLAHHSVFEALAAVGPDRRAARAGRVAAAEWLRSSNAAGAMLTFDLLRRVEERAGDVEGALARVWEVLPPSIAIAEREGRERSYGEQVVLDYWTPGPLSRLAGLEREEAERLLDAFSARFDSLSPESRKEWAAEAEVARARLALAKGDRQSTDNALMAASDAADGTRIAARVGIHAARLRAFGNGASYARDVMEALRLQAEYAERLAAVGAMAENERAELGRRLLSFWTETVNSAEPPFDRLAELFAREGGGGAGFRSAAANVLAALGLIGAPSNVGAGLAGRLLDGGGAELDETQLEEVLRRHVAAGLERAVAAGMMGNARFSRQEFEGIAQKLRAHQSAFEPALRRLLAPEVVDRLLRFGDGTGPTAA